jgi:hypothetical protein
MYLSDDPEDLQKFKFPRHCNISAGGYLIIWMDKEPNEGRFHANFKLSKNGETLFLTHKDGYTILDEINFGQQLFDVSFQRFTHEDNTWGYCLKPTPGKTNHKQRSRNITSPLPVFSNPGGFYSDGIDLFLSAPKNAQIFYTLDGSDPMKNKSEPFKESIQIDSHTVVKAQCVIKGFLPSPVVTHTFFVFEKRSLPVVSLSTDPDNLWDPVKGIYGKKESRNYLHQGKKGKKPAHFEYFSPMGEKVVDTNLDMEIAGGATRYYDKKSFAITTKNKYSNPTIKYSFFDKPINEFKSLLLRADSGGGGHYSNEMIYGVNKALGRPVVMQAYQPVALFLNGRYWGLYNLMERKGEDFIQKNYRISGPVDIITPKKEIKSGDLKQFQILINFFRENDLSEESVFEKACELIDMENYLNHTIYNLFYNKSDYNLNVRFWRPKGPDEKWRLITYDYDYFEAISDSTQPNLLTLFQTSQNDFAYEFTGSFLSNKTFLNLLANRAADYINSDFRPEELKKIIYDNEMIISQELSKDCDRWSNSYNLRCDQRAKDYEKFLKKVEHQGVDLLAQLDNSLILGGLGKIEIKVSPPNAGSVRVNSVTPDHFPWEGFYFQGVPVKIEAIANTGYKFEKWSDKKLDSASKVDIQIGKNKKSIVAVFSKTSEN